ncbi:hypothetical protein KIW84_025182 [Lathyrus oleraceus]|uniref:Uncharacterized protein n=1 Tax=Pisum sativum TaxID=3888 RepID=A0A9D4YNC6_PEA|nr:hypothetical protein KIW84_025182 [Pisum sativum]
MRHSPQIQAPPSTFIANSLPSTSSSWFPDSCASFHVIGDVKNIQQSTLFEGPDRIYIAGLSVSSPKGVTLSPIPLSSCSGSSYPTSTIISLSSTEQHILLPTPLSVSNHVPAPLPNEPNNTYR